MNERTTRLHKKYEEYWEESDEVYGEGRAQ